MDEFVGGLLLLSLLHILMSLPNLRMTLSNVLTYLNVNTFLKLSFVYDLILLYLFRCSQFGL